MKQRKSPPRTAKAAVHVSIDSRSSAFEVDRERLEAIARFALAAEKIRRAAIDVVLVDDATIHELNRKFLDHDYPTDVLTFPYAHHPVLQGEIVIGLDHAKQAAPEYGKSPQAETELYLVHGILHLCDYRDDDEREAAIMEERQTELLEQFEASRVSSRELASSKHPPARKPRRRP